MFADTWTDAAGIVRRVPSPLGKLRFSKLPLHAALRAFILQRDEHICQQCGLRLYVESFVEIRGRVVSLVIDHIVSRRNGGTHHPSNLQALCSTCNARKVSTSDVPLRNRLARMTGATA